MRQPDWDIDKARGDQGEELVRRLRSGVLAGSVEVKTDEKALRTGNVYVEVMCRRGGEWRQSGILESKANTYAFVVGDVIMALPKAKVIAACKEHGTRRECVEGSHPTRGVCVPIEVLLRHAIGHG